MNINFNYLNNYSDIKSFLNDDKIKDILSKFKHNDKVIVTSNLIHKEKEITLYEQFIFNLDNYITYIKSFIFINPLELKIILNNTLYNDNLNFLYSNKYYYSNLDYYHNIFINLFMYQYLKNIKFLKKYININTRSFTELVNHINKKKKRTYVYFEDINIQNMSFYIPIIEYLETNS